MRDICSLLFLPLRRLREYLHKFGGQTSAFVPGTPAYKYAQGKKVIYMKQEQAEMVDRLTAEYGKIFWLSKIRIGYIASASQLTAVFVSLKTAFLIARFDKKVLRTQS